MRYQIIPPKNTYFASLFFILSVTLSATLSFELLSPAEAHELSDLYVEGDHYYSRIVHASRTSFSIGGHISLHCYPSIGGYWYASDVSTIELDLIGIDRLQPQDRALNQTEEDAFCERLQLLDPYYEDDDNDKWSYLPPPEDKNKNPRIRNIFCWPKTGGVWVKKLTYKRQGGWYGGGEITVTTEGNRSLVAAIWNAHSMEERCKAFERAEGKFCAKLEDCEETKRYVGKKIWPDD